MNNFFCCNNNCFDKLRFYEIWKFIDVVSNIDRIAFKYCLEAIAPNPVCIIKSNDKDIYVQFYFNKKKYHSYVHYEIRYNKNDKKIHVEFHIEDEKLDKDPLIIKIKANLKKVPASNNKYWWGCSKDTPTEFDINDLTGIKDAFEELVKKVESIKEETEQADN